MNANISKIYVHSFGPMGILGFLLGKLVRIPVVCRCSAADANVILGKLYKFPKYQHMGKKAFRQLFKGMHQVHVLNLTDAAFAEQMELDNVIYHTEPRSDKSTFRSIADTL